MESFLRAFRGGSNVWVKGKSEWNLVGDRRLRRGTWGGHQSLTEQDFFTCFRDGKLEVGLLTHVARLEFPRETGLILRCAGKAGNPFQTTQGPRTWRPDFPGAIREAP